MRVELASAASIVARVIGLQHTGSRLAPILEVVLLAQVQLALIDDPVTLDLALFNRNSSSLRSEFMSTRSTYATAALIRQRDLLTRVAAPVDAGTLKTSMTARIAGIHAANLRRACAKIERGDSRGKIVLEGFGRQPGRVAARFAREARAHVPATRATKAMSTWSLNS